MAKNEEKKLAEDKKLQSIQKIPPHNLDAERSVLGAIMLNNIVVSQVATIIKSDDFFAKKHSLIFDAILALDKKGDPFDAVSVAAKLQDRGQLEQVGGNTYLSFLVDSVPTTASATYYAEIVKNKSLIRRLIEAGTEIVAEGFENIEDVEDYIDRSEQRIFKIRQDRPKDDLIPADKFIREALQNIKEIYQNKGSLKGILTGFDDFDRMTNGLQPSDLIILAGRPSMGKCLVADSLILQKDGTLVTIEEIVQRQKASLLTLSSQKTFVWTSPSHFVDDGIKEVYRVRTRSGRVVESTLSHPFLTQQGWQSLLKLSVGTKIAVPQKMEIFGSLSKSSLELQKIVDSLFTTTSSNHEENSPVLSSLTLSDIIFQFDRKSLALFLHFLYLKVGQTLSFSSKQLKNISSIGLAYQLPNERFARQVQHLLLRFGILSSLILEEESGSILLEITETQARVSFLKEIGLRGHEEHLQEHLRILQEHFAAIQQNGEIYWDEIVEIQAIGPKQVYDLTIPETHNFVANDICVHNTSLALNMAANVALNVQKPVVLFSLEMSSQQLATRLICSTARVDSNRIRKGQLEEDELPRLGEASSALSNAPLIIDEGGNATVMDIRAKCRRIKLERGDLGLIVIDYLQLMSGEKNENSREQEISNISRGLKSLARELDVPVLALSQLNRSLEKRPDKRPLMSDLRESGAIEQDADVILFVYRDEVYHDDTEDKGVAELIIAKQRNGPIGSVRLRFFKEYTRFDNLESKEG